MEWDSGSVLYPYCTCFVGHLDMHCTCLSMAHVLCGDEQKFSADAARSQALEMWIAKLKETPVVSEKERRFRFFQFSA